jgi:hypothetical protein
MENSISPTKFLYVAFWEVEAKKKFLENRAKLVMLGLKIRAISPGIRGYGFYCKRVRKKKVTWEKVFPLLFPSMWAFGGSR